MVKRFAPLVFLVIAALCGAWWFLYTETIPEDAYTVARAPLVQQVLFSGTVRPHTRIELGFEKSGRVQDVYVDVGDSVNAGDILATLYSDDLIVVRDRERAILAAEEARLEALQRGTREEELRVERSKVAGYENALAEAQQALLTKLLNSFTTVDSAVRVAADPLFDNPRITPRVKYRINNTALEQSLESARVKMGETLRAWEQEAATLSVEMQLSEGSAHVARALRLLAASAASAQKAPDPLSHAPVIREYLIAARTFFEVAAQYANALTPSATLSQTTIDALEANIAAERVSLANTLASLDTAVEKYVSARDTYQTGTQSLALLEAGTSPEDIRTQEANVRAQAAKVRSAETDIQKATIRAPRDGVVVDRIIDSGEAATANARVLTLDAEGNLEFDARVSELDVILLAEGQAAEVTLDAYGSGRTFEATVSHIDPAERIENGSAGYGITLAFTRAYPELRAGMTANARVSVVVKESALTVPIGYVQRTGALSEVRILTATGIESRTVRTGPSIPPGIVEIFEGLTEGDVVLPYEAP